MMKEEDILNKEMTEEELRHYIEQNDYLKINLRIMNDLPIVEKDDEITDYNQLAQNIALNGRKQTAVEYTPDMMTFYYELLTQGYEAFGEDYLIKFVTKYPEYAVLVLHLFFGYCTEISKYLESLDKNKEDSEA